MKTLLKPLMGALCALTFSVFAHAQSPGGKAWTIDGNGYIGALSLTVDSANNVTGTIYNGDRVSGFYNPSTRRIVFYRNVFNSNNLTWIQIFSGYMFPSNVQSPGAGSTMAGTFQVFSGTGGTAVSNELGWYAYRGPTIVVH